MPEGSPALPERPGVALPVWREGEERAEQGKVPGQSIAEEGIEVAFQAVKHLDW